MMKFVKNLISQFITLLVCLSITLSSFTPAYADIINIPHQYQNQQSKKILEGLNQISKVKYKFEEEEESKSCFKENEAPPAGEEENCCGDLHYYGGKCSKAPTFSRKKCFGWSKEMLKEKGNVCGEDEACMYSDIGDMFADTMSSQEKDNKLEEMIAKRENGFWNKIFKPRPNDKTCSNDKRCESWNCVKDPRVKGGKVKKKKNGKIKYKWFKRCKPLYVCRCVESGERVPPETPNAKCCPGLKKDIGNTCRDPKALGILYPEFNDKPPGVDKISCAINVPGQALFNYIKNTFSLRAFEFLTATAGNTDSCIYENLNKKLKAWGTALRDDRVAVVNAFRGEMKLIKQKRNELVNAKFQAHQTFTDKSLGESVREQAIAADRVTGKEMIKLLIEEQKLLSKYEETMMGVLKKHEPILKKMQEEYASIDENKKVKRCRGLFTSKKNKRRWKYRFKVKHRQSNANKEAVKDPEITNRIQDIVKTDATVEIKSGFWKPSYFMHDPLMPGYEKFKDYGQAFLRAGKYRRTLGKPGFIAYFVGFLVGGFIGAHLVGKHYNDKASKNEKVFLMGLRKNTYVNVKDYFKKPPVNGDLELGIDPVCLESNFQYSSQDSYQDDKEYQDTADYYEKAPKEEGSERLPSSQENETINYDDSDPYANSNDEFSMEEENEEIAQESQEEDKQLLDAEFETRSEQEGGGVNYREGKRLKNQRHKVEGAQKCIRTKMAIEEIGASAFAQLWLYSFGNKRKYESFGGQTRTRLLGAISGDVMGGMNAHLSSMHLYRNMSIQCLQNKLLEYDWGRSGGVIADKDEYKNEAEKIEWQKSKQAKLDCKNCNLKGAGGAIGIEAKKIGTTSISGSPYSFNTFDNPLIPKDRLDLKIINKKYAAYQDDQKIKNADLIKKDPNAIARSKAMRGFFAYAAGPNEKAVAKISGYDLKSARFNKQRRFSSEENKEESKQQDNMIIESGQAKSLIAGKGKGAGVGAKAKDGKKAKEKSKKDLKKLLSDDLFGDLEKARVENKGKNYSGLTDKEEKEILQNVSKVKGVSERGEISTDSSMSIFKKVSKAYVREGYPRLLNRKKKYSTLRLPSSVKAKPKKKSILDQFKKHNPGVK